MNRLRVLIVDDEPLARQGAALLLGQDPEVEIVGECDDGESALREIRTRRPDLVILDVQMPRRSGLDVLEQLAPAERPAVIFVTAYDEHAVRAFELYAVDYLLKPFRDQRFRAAVARAKDHVRRTDYRALQLQAEALIRHLRRIEAPESAVAARPESLVLKVEGELLFIAPQEIAWIEAQDDMIRLRLGTRLVKARETLQAVEQRLDPAQFVRVHRSFIVRSAAISKITPALYGDHVVLMRDGTKIRLSRTYRENLKRLISPGRPPAPGG